jgi:hypothetical protein
VFIATSGFSFLGTGLDEIPQDDTSKVEVNFKLYDIE